MVEVAEHKIVEDTLAAWLYQRFGGQKKLTTEWDRLDQDTQDWWEHEAEAVRRAVARGGFKAQPPTHSTTSM